MSTTPTELLETTAATIETTMAATEAAIAETAAAAAESGFDFDSIKSLMDSFDPAALLPDLTKIFDSLAPVCQVAVMLGPVILLALGLSYLFLAPKEANYYFGYRCYFGMGSEFAWRSTQRLAGLIFGGLGLVLTVVMFAISGRFGSMEVTDMTWLALECLAAEALAAILATLTINLTTAFKFNRKGDRRRKHRK